MKKNERTQAVHVIGAGLAGSEAAWQLAERGIQVQLHEMRPTKSTGAHHTAGFAELVCSNSLRAASVENAVGLLKEEMRQMNSLIMEAADACRIPAGGALAVDRERFSDYVTQKLKSHPHVAFAEEEVVCLDDLTGLVVVASGPLTSDALAEDIKKRTGADTFYFYDAAAPIVTAESLNYEVVYAASRYDKGDADYWNCPMSQEQYEAFWQALVEAEVVPAREFEKEIYFEGCMPVEEMARRGKDTLRFGPLKPVGLVDPRVGKEAHAVVQLRRDNAAGSLLNLVGFQTHLRWPEQQRVFRMIPGLEQAEFVRLGVMHRNTFINSPQLLDATYQFRSDRRLFFAGQMTGVEGYIESAASGLVAGINAAHACLNEELAVFPQDTALGAMAHYISSADAKHFQPMNVNFGIFPPLGCKVRKRAERNKLIAERALASLVKFKEKFDK